MELIKLADMNMFLKYFDNASRMVVAGLDKKENGIQMSATMGRSPNSRNRIYVAEQDGSGILRTEAADESKVEDPSLIIYNAMRSVKHEGMYLAHIVSNGDQTDTIANRFKSVEIGPSAFGKALRTRYCEPDPTIFTARITAYQNPKAPDVAYFSILKADPFAKEHWIQTLKDSGLNKEDFKQEGMTSAELNEIFNQEVGKLAGLDHKEFPTIRETFELPLTPGFGYCLTTYDSGRAELPPFTGEPFLVPLNGEKLEDMMQTFWNALYLKEDRVSLGGKSFNDDNAMNIAVPINKYEKVKSK